MCLRLKVLLMWSVGELQVYEIFSHRLMYSEVTEARSNYKKTYFWSFRNLTCDDSTGTERIEKKQVGEPPGLVWGKGEEGWCGFVCGKHL